MLMCRQLVAARRPDRRAARARAPSRPKSAIPGSGPVGAATVAVEARRPACGLGACRPAGLGHAPAEPPGTFRQAARRTSFQRAARRDSPVGYSYRKRLHSAKLFLEE